MAINLNKMLKKVSEEEPIEQLSVEEKKKEKAKKGLTPSLVIKQKFNNMFLYMRDDRVLEEVRTGLHASAIIGPDSDFCYREQVLSLVYEMSQGRELPVNALRIFAAGTSIHNKWQDMFKACSDNVKGFRLIRAEARSYSEKWNLYYTPDSIIEIDGIKYIVEIKSMNTFSYKHASVSSNPHPHARHQIQLYMHLTGIHQGLILIEDKNTQEFEVFKINYDYKEALPFLDRLIEINEQYKFFINEGIQPNGICKNETCKRAQNCNMRFACFHQDEAKKLNG